MADDRDSGALLKLAGDFNLVAETGVCSSGGFDCDGSGLVLNDEFPTAVGYSAAKDDLRLRARIF
jgi:hypothetical protein